MEEFLGGHEALKEMEYGFNSELQLRHLHSGKPFRFINQDHYDELADAIADFIQKLMVEKYAMKKVDLPLEEDLSKLNAKLKEEKKMKMTVRCPIYVSSDVESRDAVLILLCGSGKVMAGQWTRRLCIKDSLKTGSVLPFLDWAKEHSLGVIVLNPNYSRIRRKMGLPPIPYNESPEEHVAYVGQAICGNLSAKHFVMVAHSYGGVSTCKLLEYHGMDVVKRLRCVAFTDSVHYGDLVKELPKESQQFIAKHCINWASSTKPLDTVLEPGRESTLVSDKEDEDETENSDNSTILSFAIHSQQGCKVVSAGTDVHECTTMSAFPSICKFLLESITCAQALS